MDKVYAFLYGAIASFTIAGIVALISLTVGSSIVMIPLSVLFLIVGIGSFIAFLDCLLKAILSVFISVL